MTQAAILIIDVDARSAATLKDMIEFLDAPDVLCAAPDDWQTSASAQPLQAVFIGHSVAKASLVRIGEQLREDHPNVPVVVVKADD